MASRKKVASLVEDKVFEIYMSHLFGSADRYVIVYASNMDVNVGRKNAHIKHRKLADWVEEYLGTRELDA